MSAGVLRPNAAAKPGTSPRYEYDRERKRKLKDASRTPEQREALALAAAVKELAPSYPALKSEINEFIHLLHQRGHQSPDIVREKVMKLLQWAASVEDICEETKFAEWAVLQALAGLRAIGVAEEVPRGRVNEDGIQPTVWRLTGKASISPDVLP